MIAVLAAGPRGAQNVSAILLTAALATAESSGSLAAGADQGDDAEEGALADDAQVGGPVALRHSVGLAHAGRDRDVAQRADLRRRRGRRSLLAMSRAPRARARPTCCRRTWPPPGRRGASRRPRSRCGVRRPGRRCRRAKPGGTGRGPRSRRQRCRCRPSSRRPWASCSAARRCAAGPVLRAWTPPMAPTAASRRDAGVGLVAARGERGQADDEGHEPQAAETSQTATCWGKSAPADRRSRRRREERYDTADTAGTRPGHGATAGTRPGPGGPRTRGCRPPHGRYRPCWALQCGRPGRAEEDDGEDGGGARARSLPARLDHRLGPGRLHRRGQQLEPARQTRPARPRPPDRRRSTCRSASSAPTTRSRPTPTMAKHFDSVNDRADVDGDRLAQPRRPATCHRAGQAACPTSSWSHAATCAGSPRAS